MRRRRRLLHGGTRAAVAAPQRPGLPVCRTPQAELSAYQSEAEVDVRKLEGLHLPAAVLQRLAAEVTHPFDLTSGGPLLRILLIRLPNSSAVVLLNMHHIVGEWRAPPCTSAGSSCRRPAALRQCCRRSPPHMRSAL